MAKVRVGLVGTGFGSQVQVPGFRAVPGFEIAGVCSGHREQAEATAQRHGIPFATDDYRELVSRDDVDLVSVATPPHLHHMVSMAALRAGKHVLCEKPLARDVDQARQMVKAAREVGCLHVVDHEVRYMPVARQVKRLISEGFIGRFRYLLATVHVGHGVDPKEAPYYFTWRYEREKDGGMLTGVLSHFIDLIRYWLGEVAEVEGRTAILVEKRPVLAIDFRDGDSLGPETPTRGEREVETDDTAVFGGRVEGGGLFTVSGSWSLHHGSGVRVEIYGDEGALVVDSLVSVRGARRSETELKEIPSAPEFGLPKGLPGLVGPFSLLVSDLAKTLEDPARTPLYATFEDGLRVQEIIAAVRGR